MLDPSIDVLLEHVDSKYSLVVGAAKRARQLGFDKQETHLLHVKSNKHVGIALEEIMAGKILITPQEVSEES
jgi:DNA-directed RNA polymerase subunit omega